MKLKIIGSQSYSTPQPIHDAKTGQQTGTREVEQLRVTAIPEGDNPQQALMRFDILIHAPSDSDVTKYRPGKMLDATDLASEAVAKEQAATKASSGN